MREAVKFHHCRERILKVFGSLPRSDFDPLMETFTTPQWFMFRLYGCNHIVTQERRDLPLCELFGKTELGLVSVDGLHSRAANRVTGTRIAFFDFATRKARALSRLTDHEVGRTRTEVQATGKGEHRVSPHSLPSRMI